MQAPLSPPQPEDHPLAAVDTSAVGLNHRPAGDADRPEGETIEVRVRAVPSQLPAVRAMAGDLAIRLDFDLDTVSDLRMAVDEAAAALVALAHPTSGLVCLFTVLPTELRMIVTVDGTDGRLPRQDTFGWTVLTTLVDEVTVVGPAVGGPAVGGPTDGAADPVGIRMVKRRDTGATW